MKLSFRPVWAIEAKVYHLVDTAGKFWNLLYHCLNKLTPSLSRMDPEHTILKKEKQGLGAYIIGYHDKLCRIRWVDLY